MKIFYEIWPSGRRVYRIQTGRINEIIADIQVAAHAPTIDEYYIYTLNSPSGPVTRYARYITITETRAPTVGNAQCGGGGDSTATMWNDVNTGIGVIDVGQGAKIELIDYAAKAIPEVKALRYVKGIKILGGVTFGVSSVISLGLAVNYYENGGRNSSVLIKASLDMIMGGVGFLGPIGFGVSATYFLLDAAGTFGTYGDPLQTP